MEKYGISYFATVLRTKNQWWYNHISQKFTENKFIYFVPDNSAIAIEDNS